MPRCYRSSNREKVQHSASCGLVLVLIGPKVLDGPQAARAVPSEKKIWAVAVSGAPSCARDRGHVAYPAKLTDLVGVSMSLQRNSDRFRRSQQ